MSVRFSAHLFMPHTETHWQKIDPLLKPWVDHDTSSTMTKPLDGGITMVDGYQISNLSNLKKAAGVLMSQNIPFLFYPSNDFQKSQEFACGLSRSGILDIKG